MKSVPSRARLVLPLLSLLGLGAAASGARGDSVWIGQRELHGEIDSETSDIVVLRTGSGKITIPRREITRIVHEDEAQSLLHEGRALARNGDKKALEILDRAIAAFRKKGDKEGAEAAAKERVKLASKLDREKTSLAAPLDDPATAADGSLFLLAKDKEEVAVFAKARAEGDRAAGSRASGKLFELAQRHLADFEPRWAVGCLAFARELDETNAKALFEHETFARRKACGAAIRARDARLALAAIEPVVQEQPKEARVAYLEGRALDVAGRPADAKVAYRRALEGSDIPGLAEAPLDLLCAFARMKLTGLALKDGAPGVGPSWLRVEGAHFVVYHQLADDFRDDEVRFMEEARDRTLVRLEIAEGDVTAMGRLPLFLFKDQAAYRTGGGEGWAGGHAQTGELEDGLFHLVCTFPGRRQSDAAVVPHELAHVLVREAYADLVLPVWASEGVAMYCEPDDVREKRRASAARLFDMKRWKPVREMLERVTLDRADDDAIMAFYSESCVVFETLVDLTGSVKGALRLAARMGKKGVEAALGEVHLSVDAVDAKVRAKVGH